MNEKTCKICNETLEINIINFYAVKQRKDGFDSLCRKCRNKYHREQKAKTIGLKRKETKQAKIDSTTTTCKTCGKTKEKNLVNFYSNPKTIDGFSNVCRDCRNSYCKLKAKDPDNRSKQRKAIQEKKVELVKYKGGKCTNCDLVYDNTNASVFDFHHINESKKSFGISSNMTKSLADLKHEVDKCILLCANCHRIIHSTPY